MREGDREGNDAESGDRSEETDTASETRSQFDSERDRNEHDKSDSNSDTDEGQSAESERASDEWTAAQIRAVQEGDPSLRDDIEKALSVALEVFENEERDAERELTENQKRVVNRLFARDLTISDTESADTTETEYEGTAANSTGHDDESATDTAPTPTVPNNEAAEQDDTSEEQVPNLEPRVSTVEDRLSNLEAQLGSIDDASTPVPDRLDTVEEELGAMARESDLREVEENLSDFEARIDRRLQRLRIKALEDLANEIIQIKDLLRDMRQLMELDNPVDSRLGMIQERIGQALESSGIKQIDTDGTLDSGHRVEERRETTEYDHEEIIEEVEVGYELDGKVIRPARVVVAESPNEG